MKKTNIESVVRKYTAKLKPGHRYASFDYCYNYFKTTKDLTKDIEKSCLTLGFYLASWGMYRGSSFMLQRSLVLFKPVIEYIDEQPKLIWDIDISKYDETTIPVILDIYENVKKMLVPEKKADLVLVTKILLGVFGFVPAFDQYFCNTMRKVSKNKCGFRKLTFESLMSIKEFYDANKTVINKLSRRTHTINFLTGKRTQINYPEAKIIDMYGFTIRSSK